MHLSIFALASSEWGIARFTTDSFALIALGILISLPIQLLKGKARKANALQSEKKIEQVVWERTMAGETKQRISNVRKKAREQVEKDELEKRDLTRRKKEIAEREYVEMQDKKALTKNVRAWEKTHSAYLRTINPYATKHNDDMLATIRSEQNTTRSFGNSSRRKK